MTSKVTDQKVVYNISSMDPDGLSNFAFRASLPDTVADIVRGRLPARTGEGGVESYGRKSIHAQDGTLRGSSIMSGTNAQGMGMGLDPDALDSGREELAADGPLDPGAEVRRLSFWRHGAECLVRSE